MSEKIISLTSENIKRLRAVSITPNGGSVEIAGKNGAGKSSVLDSIFYALSGRSVLPDRPIRDGESRADVVVELNNYVVTRSFTAAGGGTLKVVPKNADAALNSPQTFLDSLTSSLSFDPLEFSRLKESEQGETLRKLLGLDFSADDARRKQYYDKRTSINRESEAIAVKLKDWMPKITLTNDPIVLSDILAQRAAAVRHNQENKDMLTKLTWLERDYQLAKDKAERAGIEVANLEAQLIAARKRHTEAVDAADAALNASKDFAGACQVLSDKDLSVFDKQILQAEEHNANLKANQEREVYVARAKELTRQATLLTVDMDSIDRGKEKALADAKFPLPGLSFSSTGRVTYNGIPFSQISTAEQIRISAAIGLALHPGLNVMFIRNGSLIDHEGLKSLITIAEQHDAQLWIERVGNPSGQLPGVVIEDGSVAHSTVGPVVATPSE